MRGLLRLVAFLVLLAGLACFVVLIEPGPRQVGEWLGRSCSSGGNIRRSRTCDALDATDLLLTFGAILTVLGAVLWIALRSKDRGPATLDLSGVTRRLRTRR
jgi:hypothetical protein